MAGVFMPEEIERIYLDAHLLMRRYDGGGEPSPGASDGDPEPKGISV